ncbi:MAG: hypothetical protein WC208_14055 [Gallionella sp.]|jgi:hypothetical protein
MVLKAKDVANSVGLAGDISISGKITRVWDKKSGTGDYGEWSFQNIVITDDTGDMTVCLKNRKDELTSQDVDKAITIKAKETTKGILGVKVEKETWEKNGEPQEAIKVIITPSGVITLDGAAPAASARQAEAAPQEEKVTAPKVALDLAQLRKDSIETTYKAWMDTVDLKSIPIDSPAYGGILAAIIRVCGPNADTLFIAKAGGKGK